MKKRIISILIICILMTGFMNYLHIPVKYAEGAGWSEMTFTPYGDSADVVFYNSSSDTWMGIIEAVSLPMRDVGFVGWYSGISDGKWHNNWYATSFNITGLPDEKVESIKLRYWVNSKDSEYPWLQYYSVYTANPADAGDYDISDSRAWWYFNPGVGQYQVKRIANVISYDTAEVGEWMEFDIKGVGDGSLSYVLDDEDGIVPFYLMNTNTALKYEPYPWQNFKKKGIAVQMWDAEHEPELIIKYAEQPAERIIHTGENAAVDDSIVGDEKLDIIEWGSPRAAFNDESLYFIFYGDSGANITASLVDSTGAVLATLNDPVSNTVRVDGLYHWDTGIPGGHTGWIRAVDNTGLKSTWGRIENSPAATQELLTTSAVSTEMNQYEYEFSSFVVYENNQMKIFWKTNLEIGDMGNYYLKIEAGGDSDKLLYVSSFDDIIDDYYSVNWTDNRYLAHWRYMIFSPRVTKSGYNSYDGMIYDIARSYMYDYTGFWTADIQNSSNVTIVDIHSSYFYLSDITQGVGISIDGTSYDQGADINIEIEVGEHSKVAERLKNIEIQILDSTGREVRAEHNFVVLGTNRLNIIAPVIEGNYKLRIIFSDTSLVDNYKYIKQLSFGVGDEYTGDDEVDAGVKPIDDFIDDWMESIGMDNPAGHWLIIIIGMLIAFLILRKSEALRVVVPLLILGAGILFEWIDLWIIILLALGAGLTVYALLRKKLSGREDG